MNRWESISEIENNRDYKDGTGPGNLPGFFIPGCALFTQLL